jgi:hypothetical protein
MSTKIDEHWCQKYKEIQKDDRDRARCYMRDWPQVVRSGAEPPRHFVGKMEKWSF